MIKTYYKKKYSFSALKYYSMISFYNNFSMQQNIDKPNFIEKKTCIKKNPFNQGLYLTQAYFNTEKFKKEDKNDIKINNINNNNISNNNNINNDNINNNSIYNNVFNTNAINYVNFINLNYQNLYYLNNIGQQNLLNHGFCFYENKTKNNILNKNKKIFVGNIYEYMKSNTFYLYYNDTLNFTKYNTKDNLFIQKEKNPNVNYTCLHIHRFHDIIYNGKKIFKLFLKGTIFSNIPTFELIKLITKSRHLNTLDLSYTNIDLCLFIKSIEKNFKSNAEFKKLYLSNLTTYSTDFSSLFSNFVFLDTLDISNLQIINTEKKSITMYNMFGDCKSLTNLYINSINTSDVFNTSNMFENCCNLFSLDLSSFDFSSLKYSYKMFAGCENLEYIKFKKQKIEIVNGQKQIKRMIDMSYMFENCISLKNLNLSSFYFERPTLQESMFLNCNSLKRICVTSKLNYGKEELEHRFFCLCKKNPNAKIVFI